MDNFKKALEFTLKWEGGLSDNKYDSGGLTNFGVTNNTYNNYRKSKNLPLKTVKDISLEEVEDIYYNMYYLKARCDVMNKSLSMVMFDTAVNFGVTGAVMFLQEAINVKADGDFGPITFDTLEANNTLDTALKMINGRIAYRYLRCKELKSQETFLQGWLNRDNDLKSFVLDNKKSTVVETNKSYYQDTVLKVAKAEIPAGSKSMEIWGSNDGPRIREYLEYVGITVPAPWCAAFVYWCIGQVVKPNVFIKNGYCPTIEEWARDNNILNDTPEPGDAFLIYDNLGPFHIGFVSRIIGNGDFNTIEGNTNNTGSPEGNTVCERTRNVSNCLFIKWHKLIDILSYDIVLKDKSICSGNVINNKTYIPARQFCNSVNIKIEWHQDTKTLIVNDRRIHDIVFINGSTYAYIRELSYACGMSVNFDAKNKKITLHP